MIVTSYKQLAQLPLLLIGLAWPMSGFTEIYWDSVPAKVEADYVAPDGLAVFAGATTDRAGNASVARFELTPHFVAKAVVHRTVDEIWYCLEGRGELWLYEPKSGSKEVISLEPGVSVSIPQGVHFQSRNLSESRLVILGVTSPMWPDHPDEAVAVPDHWPSGKTSTLPSYTDPDS